MYGGRNHTIDGDQNDFSQGMLGRAGIDDRIFTRPRSQV